MGNPNSSHSSDQDRQPASYRTLASVGQAEIKVQRSRFLATVATATDLTAAKLVVGDVARQNHDCRHVCFAWRGGIGQELQEIRNDGGEPAGTAGEPILAALRRADLTACVAVVARYFGGIKLGTGGLARAYGQATEAALQEATIRTILVGNEFNLAFAYPYHKTLTSLVTRHGGRVVHEAYGSQVDWRIWLPATRVETFAAELTMATAGQVKLKALTERPEPS